MKLRPGREVHHVVLVDPRRAAQQRPGVHLLGLRRVLDELHELVAEHDLARRRGEVARRPSKPLVSTWRGRPSLLTRSSRKVVAPLTTLAPAGVERPLQRRRVQREEVGGRERVQGEVRARARPCGATSASTDAAPDDVAGVPAASTGRPAACRRTAGSCSTRGRRTAGPSGRPAPATRSPGRTTRVAATIGMRARSVAPLQGRAGGGGRVGQARLQRRGQRVAEAGRVEVLEQIGLGCQHPCSALGDIARRLIHHAAILRGKPRTSHPLPLTGMFTTPDTCARRRLQSVDVLLVTADGADTALARRARRAARRRARRPGRRLGRRPGLGRRGRRGALTSTGSASTRGRPRTARSATRCRRCTSTATTCSSSCTRPERGARGHVHYVELDQFIGPGWIITVHGPLNPKVAPEAARGRDRRRRPPAGRRPAAPDHRARAVVRASSSALTGAAARLPRPRSPRRCGRWSSRSPPATSATPRTSSRSCSRSGTGC